MEAAPVLAPIPVLIFECVWMAPPLYVFPSLCCFSCFFCCARLVRMLCACLRRSCLMVDAFSVALD